MFVCLEACASCDKERVVVELARFLVLGEGGGGSRLGDSSRCLEIELVGEGGLDRACRLCDCFLVVLLASEAGRKPSSSTVTGLVCLRMDFGCFVTVMLLEREGPEEPGVPEVELTVMEGFLMNFWASSRVT